MLDAGEPRSFGSAVPGQVINGCLRMQAEQFTEKTSASFILQRFLLQVSAVSSYLGITLEDCNLNVKAFPYKLLWLCCIVPTLKS